MVATTTSTYANNDNTMDISIHGATSKPWWKYPLVWMIIAGPAIVVVAGFTTLWIAVREADPVIAEDYYQRGVEINKTLSNPAKILTPAVAGRNHAATPDKDSR